jgi:hypothetical protein
MILEHSRLRWQRGFFPSLRPSHSIREECQRRHGLIIALITFLALRLSSEM